MSRRQIGGGKGFLRSSSQRSRAAARSWSEPLERRVLLAAAVYEVSPATSWEPDSQSLVRVTSSPTAEPLDGDEVTPSVVNGVVFSNMAQGTGFGAFTASTGLLGVEDYNSINDANITLTEFQFAGGVSAAGGTLDFEFYNTSDVFVTGFSVSLGSAGNFLWTIGPISGVTIPDAGFLRLRAQPGTTGQWLFSNAAPTIGTQSSGLGNAPAGNSFKSELTNTSPNQPPVITSLTDSPDPVAAGGTVTLTATGVSDPDGTVANVKFYRETNGIPGLQPAADLLLSTDATSPYSVNVTAPAVNGVSTYYAQATDNGGMDGNVVSTTNTVGVGSISGTVWNDANNNQVVDGGEAVLSGWTVFLDQDRDQVLDAGEASTTTNGSGNYTFNGLAADTYFVTTVIPAGWQQTYPGVAGQISATATPVGDINARPTPLPPPITTTGSTQPIYLANGASAAPASGDITISDAQSNPLIRLTNFQGDPRFSTIRGQNSSVAVLDTGIDLDHPFFGPDLVAPFGVADRIVYHRDFADNDMDASDVNGHGTNVASIVGSQNATHGGMAPEVNIIALKVFTNAGAGNFSYIESALQWCVANAAAYNLTAINMSLGDNQNFNTSQGLYGIADELAALAAMNVMVVSAAGNDFAKFASVQGVSYPAADPNSLAVSAVYDANLGGPLTWGVSPNQSTDFTTGPDRVTSFSQRSAVLTDMMAPGAIITGGNQSGGTVNQGGTSQASPHIAGIGALAQQLAMRDLGRKLTLVEFKTLMQTSGVTINDGDDEDDSVVNTGANFKRVDVLALGEAIRALAIAPFSHTVTLSPGENAGGINFGNRASDVVAPTADIVDISPDPRQSAVGLVTINFSEPVAGVDISDFQLTRDGLAVPLAGAAFNQVNPSQYTIDLSSMTTEAGAYSLQLTATGSGIQDAASNALAANASDAWIMNAINGSAASDTLTLRRTGGASIQVVFSGNPSYDVSIAGLGANPLLVNTLGGDDVIVIDFLNGTFSPTGGISVNGGASSAGDLLVLKGTGASETATFNTASFSFGATPITYSGTEKFRFDGGNGGDTLNVDAGTYTFDTDASPATAALTVNVAAGATVNFNATQHLDGLNVAGNAAVGAGGNKVLVTNALGVTGAGKLDLRDNDLVLNYSAVSPMGTFSSGSYNGIAGLIDAGRGNAPNAVWNGNGIITSDVRAIGTSNRTSLAIAEASQALGIAGTQTGTFAGQIVDATAVLVKFSWGGDATLDGKINIDDYGRIDSNVASSGSVFGWYNGDYNYDGSINIDDYGIIDSNISQQTGEL